MSNCLGKRLSIRDIPGEFLQRSQQVLGNIHFLDQALGHRHSWLKAITLAAPPSMGIVCPVM